MLESLSGCAERIASRICSEVAGPFAQTTSRMACWKLGERAAVCVTLRHVTICNTYPARTQAPNRRPASAPRVGEKVIAHSSPDYHGEASVRRGLPS